MKRHLLILFCLIQVQLMSQISFEILNDTILLRKFKKSIKVDIMVKVGERNISDTLIFFNNKPGMLFYNVNKEDHFFQLNLSESNPNYRGRNWGGILRLHPHPTPQFLPKVKRIKITKDTTLLKLKLSANILHEVFFNYREKRLIPEECLIGKLSYSTNDYLHYIIHLKNNKQFVNYTIYSNNNVIVKRAYSKSSTFTNWVRKYLILPNVGIYPFMYHRKLYKY